MAQTLLAARRAILCWLHCRYSRQAAFQFICGYDVSDGRRYTAILLKYYSSVVEFAPIHTGNERSVGLDWGRSKAVTWLLGSRSQM
jgi:hypothetical protein